MKTAILLFALISWCLIPTYSQINIHRKTDTSTDQFLGKKNHDLGNYNFVGKFNDAWSDRALGSFNRSPVSPAPGPGASKFTKEIYSGDDMPCLQTKGNYIPCLNPKGISSMRIYKPESVTWGTLWSDTHSIVR
jgi:hypothetical protein